MRTRVAAERPQSSARSCSRPSRPRHISPSRRRFQPPPCRADDPDRAADVWPPFARVADSPHAAPACTAAPVWKARSIARSRFGTMTTSMQRVRVLRGGNQRDPLSVAFHHEPLAGALAGQGRSPDSELRAELEADGARRGDDGVGARANAALHAARQLATLVERVLDEQLGVVIAPVISDAEVGGGEGG